MTPFFSTNCFDLLRKFASLRALFSRAGMLLLLVTAHFSLANPIQAQTKPPRAANVIYERCHSSVVVVIPLDSDNKALGQGSGFIIAENKIVTNHHVLGGAA